MFVYPAPRQSVQGRGSYSFVSMDGTQIPAKRTFAKNARKTYMFPSSIDNSKINTGMSEQIENPFKNKEFADKYISSNWLDQKEKLEGLDYISKQTYYEVCHNRPAGTYTDEKKVKTPFDPKAEDTNFFERYKVELVDDTNVFSSDDPDGALAMMCMYINPLIANSKDECNPSIHDFYIGQEHEIQIEKQNKRSKISKAISKLVHIKDNYDEFTLYQLGIVLEVIKGTNISNTIVVERIEDYIWNNSTKQMSNIDNFQKYANMITDSSKLVQFQVEYLIRQAINVSAIGISGGRYIWHSQQGIDNLYNLGTRGSAVYNLFAVEKAKYNPELEDDNIYGKLIRELKTKGIRVD